MRLKGFKNSFLKAVEVNLPVYPKLHASGRTQWVVLRSYPRALSKVKLILNTTRGFFWAKLVLISCLCRDARQARIQ